MNKKELLDKKIKIMKEFLKNNGDIKVLKVTQENPGSIDKIDEKNKSK